MEQQWQGHHARRVSCCSYRICLLMDPFGDSGMLLLGRYGHRSCNCSPRRRDWAPAIGGRLWQREPSQGPASGTGTWVTGTPNSCSSATPHFAPSTRQSLPSSSALHHRRCFHSPRPSPRQLCWNGLSQVPHSRLGRAAVLHALLLHPFAIPDCWRAGAFVAGTNRRRGP